VEFHRATGSPVDEPVTALLCVDDDFAQMSAILPIEIVSN
jgi:hypothetical protein